MCVRRKKSNCVEICVEVPSYALFCTLRVVLNSRCSSQGVDIFGIIGIPKNRKFYALSFISIVKLRIVKQKA